MPTLKRKPPKSLPCPAAVAARAECDRLRAGVREERGRRRKAEKEADALAADNARLEKAALELLAWVDKLVIENEHLRDTVYRRAMGGGA